jgi:hypothetical protein
MLRTSPEGNVDPAHGSRSLPKKVRHELGTVQRAAIGVSAGYLIYGHQSRVILRIKQSKIKSKCLICPHLTGDPSPKARYQIIASYCSVQLDKDEQYCGPLRQFDRVFRNQGTEVSRAD